MKIIQKILLIISGILIALIILELSLQTAGFVASSYQRYRNNQALKNKSEYKIMCLGESTTYGGYPKELQNMLNQKYPNKFTVIDCGVPGNNLDNILSQLDINIAKYNPDFAICMMGINDGFISLSTNKPELETKPEPEPERKKISYLKTYELYHLLRKHIILILQTNFDAYYVLKLYCQKKYSYAELVCEKILESPQNDYSLASFLAMVQYDHLDKRDCAYRAASDIIENNKKLDNRSKNIVYRIVIDYNLQNKNNALMQKYIDKLINDDNVFFDAKLYGFIKDFINLNQKKEFFNKMAKFEESLDQCYGIRAIESMDKKDYKKAEEYFAKAEEVRLKYPREQTYNLYKLIVDKLVDNNIKVLSMQYPVRSIKPLKQMLKNEEYYDRIIFINNENNFKDLLKTKQFKEVFEDQFAGDFGHYKQDGSVLIAENVIARLEKIIINNGQNI
jgi:hypothetical protein